MGMERCGVGKEQPEARSQSVSQGRGCLVGIGVGAGPAGGSEEAIQREQLGVLGSREGLQTTREDPGVLGLRGHQHEATSCPAASGSGIRLSSSG